MRLHTVLGFLMLTPVAAFAQNGVEISFVGSSVNERSVRADNCGESVSMRWQVPTNVTACSDFEVWLSTANNCENEPPEGAEILASQEPQNLLFLNPTGDFSINIVDLPLFSTGDGGAACGAEQIEQTFRVCGAFKASTSTIGPCASEQAIKDQSPPTLRYDSLPPEVPTIDEVLPLKGSALVSFTVGEDTRTVVGQARLPGSDTIVASEEVSVPENVNVEIDGLENGVTYEVTLVARDLAGNESAPTAPQEVTPVEVCGFYCRVVEDGGPSDVGCSAAGGATLGISALLVGAFGLARRRRTWR